MYSSPTLLYIALSLSKTILIKCTMLLCSVLSGQTGIQMPDDEETNQVFFLNLRARRVFIFLSLAAADLDD